MEKKTVFIPGKYRHGIKNTVIESVSNSQQFVNMHTTHIWKLSVKVEIGFNVYDQWQMTTIASVP